MTSIYGRDLVTLTYFMIPITIPITPLLSMIYNVAVSHMSPISTPCNAISRLHAARSCNKRIPNLNKNL